MTEPAEPARYADVAACYAALFPDADRLYVSPDIASSAANNPYLRNLYAGLTGARAPISVDGYWPFAPVRGRRRGERSIWHHHWLQCSSLPTLLRATLRLMAARRYARRGGHVLWTVHNLEPHVPRLRWANRWLTRSMAQLAERLLVHSPAAAAELSRAWSVPAARIAIVPHPAYVTTRVDRAEARARLREHYGITLGETRVFLVFGLIARYKQVPETMQLFDGLDAARVRLLVAGAVRGSELDHRAELQAALGRGPVALCDRFIPDEHVPWFFGAADVVLFNYRQILTSGAIELARNYEKPVWIPDLPALADIVGPDVRRFGDLRELREAVAKDDAAS
ncbi:MAG TPA: glycosyltransferase [Polyangiales bacterium]|nr:glycosyltransferase [Polyangiales bacterium]